MDAAQDNFELVCQAADPAAVVGRLDGHELRQLRDYCGRLETQNGGAGGIPAQVRWLCVLSAADRFFAAARPT
jgi:hypothetical protein